MSEGPARGAIAAGLANPTGPMAASSGGVPPGPAESVYTPLARLPSGDQAVCELRTLTDGRLALLVYASPAELVECCGPAQPWAEIPSARVEELRGATGADVVVDGAPLPATSRRDPPDHEAPSSPGAAP